MNNTRMQKKCTEVAFHEKKYTKIFVNEAILLPSRLAVVDSHSFASISSTYKLNRKQKLDIIELLKSYLYIVTLQQNKLMQIKPCIKIKLKPQSC
jgi:hypothetical protein